MREMREYQQKLLNSESKITLCQWTRQTGKTTTIFMDIENDILDDTKYLHIIVNNSLDLCIVKAKLLKIYFETNTNYRVNWDIDKGNVFVSFHNRENDVLLERLIITPKHFVNEVVNDITDSDAKFKIYYDDYYPLMSNLTNILRRPNSKIVIFHNDIPDINIINSNNKYIDIDEDWYTNEMNKLKKEFSDIEGQENNTKRRECLLSMIRELSDMKKDNL